MASGRSDTILSGGRSGLKTRPYVPNRSSNSGRPGGSEDPALRLNLQVPVGT